MRLDLNYAPQATVEGSRSGAANAAAASGTNRGPRSLGDLSGDFGNGIGEDQAQLSGARTQVLALSAQAAQLPEVRQQRVQALRQAVESGQYQANHQQVAGAVFAHLVTAQAA